MWWLPSVPPTSIGRAHSSKWARAARTSRWYSGICKGSRAALHVIRGDPDPRFDDLLLYLEIDLFPLLAKPSTIGEVLHDFVNDLGCAVFWKAHGSLGCDRRVDR